MQRQNKRKIAIEELSIKINSLDPHDQYQVDELLFQMLDYPTIADAQTHFKATRLGYLDSLLGQKQLIRYFKQKNCNNKAKNDIDQLLKICDCCGRIVNQKQLSYCTSISDVNIGKGVHLYFSTLSIYVAIMFLSFVYGIFALQSNMNLFKKNSLSPACASSISCSTLSMSLNSKMNSSNQAQKDLIIQSVLGIVYLIIWGIVLVKKDKYQKQIEFQHRMSWLSASQFTLMLSRYPSNLIQGRRQSDVLKMFQKQFQQYFKDKLKSNIPCQVIKYNLAYPLYIQHHSQQNIKRQQQITQIRQKFISIVRERQYCTIGKKFQQRQQLYQKYRSLNGGVKCVATLDINSTKLQQKCAVFVTLRYSAATIAVLNYIKNNQIYWSQGNYDFPVEGVKIQKAPQPEQIKWNSIGFPKQSKMCRKILIYFIALILIGTSLTLSIVLGRIQYKFQGTQLSLLISIMITIINEVIQITIIYVSLAQRQFLQSKQEISIGIKVAMIQVINSIGVPLFLAQKLDGNIYKQNGLVTSILFLALINMFLPFIKLLDISYWIKKAKIFYFSRFPIERLHRVKGQVHFNQMFQGHQFQLGQSYAYIIKTVYFTLFFLPLQPIIGMFAPFALLLTYFINKYRIYYRCSKPNFQSSLVNDVMGYVLKLAMIIFSIGQLFFVNFQGISNKYLLIINSIQLGLCLLFIFFPFTKWIFSKSIQIKSLDYNKQQIFIVSDYDRVNPITKQKAIQHFKLYLQNNNNQSLCELKRNPRRSQLPLTSLLKIPAVRQRCSDLNIVLNQPLSASRLLSN